ncbi:hypothetical protein PR202_ga31338 [Eleusine coracana subsp. coracana]|uniref:Agenet domain-containing protein n=1 Tax=Eleusine coracana subsp. coracana TaxID=191504 RepID=A0AAV5DS27_ELECO|nr:hypothetical protein PR202_ga31338 [Eleusine coracana subsp. coracana]
MIRPTFPQWYWENQIPDQHPKTDVMAIVSSPWKVGDLIEWWFTECYWSGKIIELLADDKVKIVLHDPPIGEGGFYDADCKNLRPALDWSLENGWSVPLSQAYSAAALQSRSNPEHLFAVLISLRTAGTSDRSARLCMAHSMSSTVAFASSWSHDKCVAQRHKDPVSPSAASRLSLVGRPSPPDR